MREAIATANVMSFGRSGKFIMGTKLSAYDLGREVAVLESIGDFKSVLTYIPKYSGGQFCFFDHAGPYRVLHLG